MRADGPLDLQILYKNFANMISGIDLQVFNRGVNRVSSIPSPIIPRATSLLSTHMNRGKTEIESTDVRRRRNSNVVRLFEAEG